MNDLVKEPTENASLSVVLAGGGTAGHVEPAMAVADALVKLDPQVRITALGTARGLETTLVPERGYALELITPVPLTSANPPAIWSAPSGASAPRRFGRPAPCWTKSTPTW